MKALAMNIEKYFKDTQLIVESYLNEESKNYENIKSSNDKLLAGIEGIQYIDKVGPDE